MIVSIIDSCNLNCSYCFARGKISKGKMTIKDFEKIISFMKKNQDHQLKILGGEPTLHPEFDKFLKLVKIFAKTYPMEVTILTNGINLKKYVPFIPDNSYVLINYNDLNFDIMNKINDSIKEIQKINSTIKICLGCNLYASKDDYSYFWKAVDFLKPNGLRVSVVSPSEKEFIENRDFYFRKMKDKFLNFIREVNIRNRKVLLDCSYIPPCYFDGQEMFEIWQAAENENEYCKCQFFGQVFSDLTYKPCFGDSFFCDKNADYTEIYNNVYSEKEKEERIQNHFMEKCETCYLKKTKKCMSGCLGFV